MLKNLRCLAGVLVQFLTCSMLYAQEVKGVVIDLEGNPLSGVGVVVEGTSNGTITGLGGDYSLDLKGAKEPVLQFSLIGMKTINEPYRGNGVINVTMAEDSKFLDEVVVVGYQEVKRKDLLGAVASVSSSKLEKI